MVHTHHAKRRLMSKAAEVLRSISGRRGAPIDSPDDTAASGLPPWWVIWVIVMMILGIFLWVATADAQAGKKGADDPVGEIASMSCPGVFTLRFDPTGKRAVSTSGQQLSAAGYYHSVTGAVHLWDLERRVVTRTWRGGAPAVFNHDGGHVACGCYWLDIVDHAKGKVVDQMAFGKGGQTIDFTFSKDGKWSLIPAADGFTRILYIPGGRVYRQFKHEGSTACFSPDGKQVLTGGRDGDVQAWDIEADRQGKTYEGHRKPVALVRALADGRVVSVCQGGVAIVWDLKTGKHLQTINLPNFGGQQVTFPSHRDVLATNWVAVGGGRLLAAHAKGGLTLWELSSGKRLWAADTHKGMDVMAVALSEDGQYALSAGRDERVRYWRLPAIKAKK